MHPVSFSQKFHDVTGDSLKVLIVYDELASGLRAMRIYNRQITPYAPAEVTLDLWKAEPLGIEEVRNAAVKQAREADLILVSLRGDAVLAPEIKLWIEHSLDGKTSPGAMALLLNPEFSGTVKAAGLHAYFEQLARKNGIEFIAGKPAAHFQEPDARSFFGPIPAFEGF
jgi:hypothetical protein